MVDKSDIKTLIKNNAASNGWVLNEDESWLEDLIEFLWQNHHRYGYPACPCRLARGNFQQDKDIICPCDYAAPDIEEFGHCYCALFFSEKFFKDKRKLVKIPDRRPKDKI